MAKFKKYEIGSDQPFVINLAHYLPEHHLCKQMEQVIFELDTSMLEASYSELGQNALHPKLMLGIIFYGYTVGLRSGRKLAQACEEQLPFIYLSKGYRPKKSSINDFRKLHYAHFADLFVQVLKKCQESGLGDASISIVDGSKEEANSSMRRTKTKEQYEKWQQTLLADIADLEMELASSEQNKKLAAKKRLHQKISDAIGVLDTDPSRKALNLTDADSPIMKGKKGNFDTNYNIQVGCGEDQIITYCDVVVDGNDKAQLIPALEGIQANTGQQVSIALADADFGTFDSLEYMDKHHICGYVPYRDMNATFEDQPFHSTHFDYDAQEDVYICPAKELLVFKSIKNDRSRAKQYRQYRTKACQNCPFQKQCTPSEKSPYRTILRETRQDLRDQMKQRLNSPEGKKMYARRLHPIEAIFGHLKYNLGYTRFLLRGLEKVKAEFTLMCLTYNLRKLVKQLFFLLNRLGLAILRRFTKQNILQNPIFQRTWRQAG